MKFKTIEYPVEIPKEAHGLAQMYIDAIKERERIALEAMLETPKSRPDCYLADFKMVFNEN